MAVRFGAGGMTAGSFLTPQAAAGGAKKSLLMVGRTGALVSGEFVSLIGYGDETTTEANTQVQVTETMTFSNLAFNINSGGSGTNNLQFRDTGGNGTQLATRAGAGLAEDTVNTDTLTAGDTVALAYTDNGSNSVISWIAANVTFASGYGGIIGASNFAGVIYDLDSPQVRYLPLFGYISSDGTATEANVAFRARGYESFEAMQVFVVSNARTSDTIIRNRINGANGTGVITIPASGTGLFTDTGIGDAIADGNSVCLSIEYGTGAAEDLVLAFYAATLKSASNEQDIFASASAATARTADPTEHYTPLGVISAFGTFTEAQARCKIGFAGTAKNLRCYVSANTYTGDATLSLYQNGSPVITQAITAGAANQWFENTGSSITFDADDELSFAVKDGTANSASFHMFGITLAAS